MMLGYLTRAASSFWRIPSLHRSVKRDVTGKHIGRLFALQKGLT